MRRSFSCNLICEHRSQWYDARSHGDSGKTIEGTVSAKYWGRNGIFSVTDTLVTYPVTTSVPTCACSQSPPCSCNYPFMSMKDLYDLHDMGSTSSPVSEWTIIDLSQSPQSILLSCDWFEHGHVILLLRPMAWGVVCCMMWTSGKTLLSNKERTFTGHGCVYMWCLQLQ